MDPPPVSLPSIHEMFPEHLMAKKSPPRAARRPSAPSPSSSTSSKYSQRAPRADVVSFDVLRSDPAGSSLQHLVSSTTLPSRGATAAFHPSVERGNAPAFRVAVRTPPPSDDPSSPASPTSRQANDPPSAYKDSSPGIISFAVSATAGAPTVASANPAAADDPGNASEGDDATADGPTSGKKHVCPTCFKRFNRPSSLRIHVNTHTGATPFRCPWPNCGREFNVNSNMRRHYRNHTTPGFSRQPNDNRRRRRRIEPSGIPQQPLPGELGGVPTLRRVPPDGFMHPYHPAYISDDSDGYESDYGRKDYEDEEYAYASRPRSWGGPHLSQSMARVSVGSSRSSSSHSGPQQQQHEVVYSQQQPPSHRHSQSHHSYPHEHQGHHHPPPPPPPHRPVQYHHPQYRHPHHHHHHHHQVSPRHHPYALPHTRSSYAPPPSTSHRDSSESPSPSPSPPPPPQARYPEPTAAAAAGTPSQNVKEGIYNASAPYSHSMADSRVSTTLRPAFHAGPARLSSERSGGYSPRVSAGSW